jgi:hypothetical protein
MSLGCRRVARGSRPRGEGVCSPAGERADRPALAAAKGTREKQKLARRALRLFLLASVPHFAFSPPGDPKVVPVGEKAGRGAGARESVSIRSNQGRGVDARHALCHSPHSVTFSPHAPSQSRTLAFTRSPQALASLACASPFACLRAKNHTTTAPAQRSRPCKTAPNRHFPTLARILISPFRNACGSVRDAGNFAAAYRDEACT